MTISLEMFKQPQGDNSITWDLSLVLPVPLEKHLQLGRSLHTLGHSFSLGHFRTGDTPLQTAGDVTLQQLLMLLYSSKGTSRAQEAPLVRRRHLYRWG